MQDIMTFLQTHWALSTALIVVLLLLILIELIKQKRGGMRLSPAQVTRLINHENAVIIDVRNSDAYAKGHIIGAISIPLKDLNDKNKKIEKYKSQPIVLVCGTGAESLNAVPLLAKQGFNVSLLQGGLRAWQDANLPIIK